MIWIALQMLFHDRPKLFGMITAVAVAVFLVINQLSIIDTYLPQLAAAQVRDAQDANLWVMDPATDSFDTALPLTGNAAQRVRSVAGVAWAVPMGVTTFQAIRSDGKARSVSVVAVDDASLAGLPPRTTGWPLRSPGTALMDQTGFATFFPGQQPDGTQRLRLENRELRIVGLSGASVPYSGFSVLHVSQGTLKWLRPEVKHHTAFVIGRTAAGYDPAQVARAVGAATALRARTTDEFAADSYGAINEDKGIPVLFQMIALVGLVVGGVVTGQTFLMFVKENARHLAVLKVLGVTHRQLAAMLAGQTLLVVALGCAVGLALAAASFEGFRTIASLRDMYIRWPTVLGASAAMAVITALASTLSLRQVIRLEAAAVFRG